MNAPTLRNSRKSLPRSLRKFQTLSLALLEDRSMPSISGSVFHDYNANGVRDTASVIANNGLGTTPASVDGGVAGITVTAFNSNNTVAAAAISDANGNYSLATAATGSYRVEFTGLPTGVFFGPQGTSSGSAVQFVNGSAINVNLAVLRPEDFTPNNPTIATSLYVVGGIAAADLNPGSAVIVSFPGSAGSADSDPVRTNHQNPATHELSIAQRDVGTTWGLAFDANTNKLYASAFMKRTSSFGPSGPGAIYQTGTFGTAASLYADLNSIFTDNPAGNLAALYTDMNGNAVPYRQNVSDPTSWFTDGLVRFTDNSGVVRELGWDAVGKIALGGLDASADGSRLYTMALGDRRLYSLPTGGDLNRGTVQRFNLPVPSTVTGITAANPLGDLRPFAVEEYRGIIYIGAVNSAESTQNAAHLRAYVFAFDPATGRFLNGARQATTTEAVFEFALNYERGQIHQGFDPIAGGFTPPDPAEWNPWSPVARSVQQQPAALGRSGYPQPMLTGISFDAAGNLTLGLRDRSGDQFGRNVPISPDNLNDYSFFSMTAGDTLRAAINVANNLDAVQANPGTLFAGWTLESNSRSGGAGTGPVSNGQGPGGGEFYFDDDFPRDPSTMPVGLDVENDEVSMGAVLQLPGTGQTLATSFDPIRQVGAINGGGVRWYDNATGSIAKSYELYVTPTNTNTNTFAKGNGLGDLVAITSPPPIEIGNYVWNDLNRNGVQDAGETGLANVSIDLFDGNTKVATVITDANGNYIFSSGTGTSNGSHVYGLPLRANSDYQLRVNRTQTSLGGRAFTLRQADASANGTMRDSNVDSFGVAQVRTSLLGRSDHSYDIGVSLVPSLSLGDTVWNDLNNDGRKTDNEPGVDTVVVRLFAADGVTLLDSQTTANGGRYLFQGLEAGNYIVEIAPPTGFVSSTGAAGRADGPFEPGTSSDENNADHGSNAGAVIRSNLVVLANTNVDGSAYLRVDFGLIRPLSIGNFVFNDVNNDGIRQDTETGLGGVALTLRTATGGFVASTLSNSAGGYLFTNLTPGSYFVEIARASLPGSEYHSSTGAESISSGTFEPADGTSLDSTDHGTTVGSTVRGTTVNLGYGNQPFGEAATAGGIVDNAEDANGNLRQDFGFFRTLTLGNLVWYDVNNDGRRQTTEAGAANVVVRLLDAQNRTLNSTTTNSAGEYLFTSLFPGTYRVEIVPPSGFRSSSGGRALDAGPFEPALQTQDDDQDKGTTDAALGVIRSGRVTLAVAGSPSNPSLGGIGDLTVDFGLVLPEVVVPPDPPLPVSPPPPLPIPASVSGFVYRDIVDTNGQRDTGETGIGGVRVVLVGAGLTQTAFTDVNGFYQFTNLPAGSYVISETQPRGFYDGLDTPGSLGGSVPSNDVLTVALTPGQNGVEYNFGEVLGAAIFGYVYEDLNRNRRFDAGEPGIPNVTITISGTAFAGTPMAHPLTAAESINGLTTRTDANGRWEFPLLPAGSYTIVETQPDGYQDFFESVQEPRLRPVGVGNDVFDNATLDYNETRGPLNFGEVRPVVSDPTKRNFLGSTEAGGLQPSVTPAATVGGADLNLNPPFKVSTGTPQIPAFVVTAAAAGRSPLIRVFDYAAGVERFRFFAYEESYTGGVRVATGDVDGDGTPDIVAATGQGGGPRVRVFSGVDGSIIRDFFAYEAEFRGGVFVAAADVNGDGKADIITGTELGGGPRLTVFDAVTGARIQDFFAFDSAQRGGIRVSAADFNNDGIADLVATAGRGTQTRVRVFDGRTRAVLTDFVPYDDKFNGGVFIAAGDITGDGIADIVTGADTGGGPHVQVFDGLSGKPIYGFFADDAGFRGGVRLALQDVDGDGKDEIVTGTGPGSPARIRIWKNGVMTPIEEFYAFDSSITSGVYVG